MTAAINSKATLDDILLRLEQEIRSAPFDPYWNALNMLEADQVLEGVVRMKRDGQFVRICQDLKLSPGEIEIVASKVKWRG